MRRAGESAVAGPAVPAGNGQAMVARLLG